MVLLAGGLVVTRPGYTHATLIESDPAPGSEISSSPYNMRLTFSEPAGPGSTITLFDRAFATIDVLTEMDDEQTDSLSAQIPALEPGVYTVQWLVLSQDGHPQSGTFEFSVVERASVVPFVFLAVVLVLLMALVIRSWRGEGRVD